jgi:hypothetical protein
MTDKELDLEARVAALEADKPKAKTPAKPDGVPLAECNRRYLEVSRAQRAERKSAAEVAKKAVEAALMPNRFLKADRRVQKNLSPAAAELAKK